MDTYYAGLARERMIQAQSELERASHYIAVASREDGVEFALMENINKLKKKLAAELERLAYIIKDKDLCRE